MDLRVHSQENLMNEMKINEVNVLENISSRNRIQMILAHFKFGAAYDPVAISFQACQSLFKLQVREDQARALPHGTKAA